MILVSSKTKKWLGVIVATLCIFYAFLLLKGSWDYWANFANLPKTNGRWFPTGFEEMKRTSYRSWYEVNDILMPSWLRWIEPLINYGDAYEKIPRFLPYAILPFGSALLLLRFLQAAIRVLKDEQNSLIVSHEVEEALDQLNSNKTQGKQ